MKKTKNIFEEEELSAGLFPISAVAQCSGWEKTFQFVESSALKGYFYCGEINKKAKETEYQLKFPRDKKKCYVNGLEQKNKELARESENLKLENEKLRQQIL